MKKRIIAMFVLGAMLVTVLGGCAKSGTDTEKPVGKEKVIVLRAAGDPQTLNPDLAADDNAYPMVQNIYSRLVKLDSSKNVIPDLAEKWEFSQDGMTVTFHLRKGVKWHDGKPLTAEDAAYTMSTIKANSTYFLSANLQSVKSFEAKDENTLVMNMHEPNVAIIGYLGWFGSFILPKHIYDNGKPWDENEANMKPVGSGPFKFESFKPGVSITLVKNSEYWEGSPKIDKAVYQIIPDNTTAVQALLNGQIDILESVPDSEYTGLSKNDKIRLKENIYPSPLYIAFNMKDGVTKDENVRRALSMCIDREAIAAKVFGGIRHGEYQFYPTVVEWASNSQDKVPPFDPAGAAKLLESAGYKKDAEGYYIRKLTFDVFESGGCPDIAKLMQAECKKAGIELALNVQEYNAWNQKVVIERNFTVEMQGGFQGPDPAALASRVATGGSMNQSQYSNPEVDKLFKEAEKVSDQKARGELYKKVQTILAKDLPIVPIVDYTSYDACGANVINAPIDGAGKWGWAELTFTDFK